MSTDLIRVKRQFSSQVLEQIIRLCHRGEPLSEPLIFYSVAMALGSYVDFQLDWGTDLMANLSYKFDTSEEDWPWWPRELVVPSEWLMTREMSNDVTVFVCKSFFWPEHDEFYKYPCPKDTEFDKLVPLTSRTSFQIMETKIGVDEIRPVAQRIIDSTPTREHPRLEWVEDDAVMTPLGLPAGMRIHWWETPIEEPDDSEGGIPWARGRGAEGVWL